MVNSVFTMLASLDVDEKPFEEEEMDIISMFGKKKKKTKAKHVSELTEGSKEAEAGADVTVTISGNRSHRQEDQPMLADGRLLRPLAPLAGVRTLILDDEGCNAGCVRATAKLLRTERRFEVSTISAAQLVNGILDRDYPGQATVLLIPGGEAMAQREGLKEAAPIIRTWLCRGGPGGILGVCGGAVVSSSDAKRGLGFAPGIQLVNDNAWANTGFAGTVKLEWSLANPLGVVGGRMRMSYENGPLLKVSESRGSGPHRGRGRRARQPEELDGTTEVWASYISDIATDLVAEDASALEAAAAVGDPRWACVACSTWQKPSVRKCSGCGASKREAEKASRTRRMLAGQMPGQAAITATTLRATGEKDEVTISGGVDDARVGHGVTPRASARVLLFGPHPEFGGTEAGLCRGVLWVAGES